MFLALPPIVRVTALLALVVATAAVFGRVAKDYRERRGLTRAVAAAQTGLFALYALSSYLLLDSRPGAIETRLPWLAAAFALMAVGLGLVLAAMPHLGWGVSFGSTVGELRTSGPYRFSRNPQIVGFVALVFGYALLWPSVPGMLWASISVPMSHVMVRAEEDHLASLHGGAYAEYCRRTPRYLGRARR